MRALLAIVLLVLTAATVQAQVVYRWTDERGEVHYGHAVPPEHAHRGYDRLGPDGVVRERVERALTEEERAERNARLRREAELAAEQRSQETRDRQLLAAYASEADIVQAMTLQINALNQQRASIRDSLRRASTRFEDLVAHAARLTHDGQEVPDRMHQNIRVAREEIHTLRQALVDMDQREQDIRDRSRAERIRFRELTSSGES